LEENMNVLITYSSQTGNTRRLAEVVYDHLKAEKKMVGIEDAPSPEGYDLVVVGFWLMAGKPDPNASKYLSNCSSSTRLFLLATHGAASDSDHVKNAFSHAAGLTDNAQVVGVFSCQGEVNPQVLEKVRQKEEPPVWLSDANGAVGHPNETDLAALRSVLDTLSY
jgi:flavodoxin I